MQTNYLYNDKFVLVYSAPMLFQLIASDAQYLAVGKEDFCSRRSN